MTDKSKMNDIQPIPLGSTAAALISAAMGCLAMSIAHQAATQSKALEALISNLAVWIPDSIEISSYPGIEIIGLVIWLISWFVLNRVWKQRDLSLMLVLTAFMGIIVLSTIIYWFSIENNISSALLMH
ncbi:hypothetical protein DSM106972_066680 [Dulcicalothrix desertica PCC 7102]|uniref:Uncharacterized protein n=1 Tax=Dulcicalothrix desertica PCC 7102 TaxID=232991 RepID=A0A433V692_9CYAN|nr:hypothetical protein [Dulcicalothrix desertica]RUT01571.1 hypothetical protein DSM106972_066680 [Dulcicalothrix desertica PCC 7102]